MTKAELWKTVWNAALDEAIQGGSAEVAQADLEEVSVKVFDNCMSYVVFDDGSVREEFTGEVFTTEQVVTANEGEEGVERELYETVMSIHGVGKAS
jgi:hypothetical protein